MTPLLPFDATAGARALSAADPVLAAIIERVGAPPVGPGPTGELFEALVRSIIYQQIHGKAAAAIHGRVRTLFADERVEAVTLLTLSEESLRGAGLSAGKLRALRDLATKTVAGTVPSYEAATDLSDEQLIERITSVHGIGPWTVQMLLMFYLGRPDVLPTGDFAIRKAFSVHFRRGRACTPRGLERHAMRWRPHRTAASWYLWRSLDPALDSTFGSDERQRG